MNCKKPLFGAIGLWILIGLIGCANLPLKGLQRDSLIQLVKAIQPAVVTVVTYDIDGAATGLGSGFFIDAKGTMVTNYHVLKGAYRAEVKTYDGEKYPIELVLAENEEADIIKVRVAASGRTFSPVRLADYVPSIGERVLVVGSPLGLEQTVSEGIVSAIRDLPGVGIFFQLSAPISPGSSGSPVVNAKGRVLGVVSFQATMGQNINFAVAARAVYNLKSAQKERTLSEWTYELGRKSPALAEELCKKGFSFSIRGEFKEALNYYKEAAEKNPEDAAAWYGLGGCYIGLDDPDAAISAFQQAVRADPQQPTPYYNLGRYYAQLGRDKEAIQAYRQALAVDPDHAASYLDLGLLYSKQGDFAAAEAAFLEVVRIQPAHPMAYYFIGLVNAEQGRYEAAIRAYRQVLRIDPESLPALYQLGVVFGKLGNVEDEVASYRAALKADPDFAPAHYGIGLVYLRENDKAAALEEYKILKRLDADLADKLFDRIYQPR